MNDVRPGRLTVRLAGASALVGAAVGTSTALLMLFFLFNSDDAGVVISALVLPFVLFLVVAVRVAVNFRGGRRRRSRVSVAVAAVLLLALGVWIANVPMFEEFLNNLDINAVEVTRFVLYGTVYGLIGGAVTAVVLLVTTLVARAARARISLGWAQALLTVAAMMIANAMALWPTGPDIPVLAATALAGIGAAFTARWILVHPARAGRVARASAGTPLAARA